MARRRHRLIYGLVEPRNGLVRYVGQSSVGMARPSQHLTPSHLARDRSHCGNWLKQLVRLGLRPEIWVLEEGFDDQDALDDAEIFWIQLMRSWSLPLVNHRGGGAGGGKLPRGQYFSRETIEKALEVRRRFGIAPMRGKRHTPAARAKMRQAHLGLWVPGGVVAKRGQRQTEAWRARQSATMKGRRWDRDLVSRRNEGQRRTKALKKAAMPLVGFQDPLFDIRVATDHDRIYLKVELKPEGVRELAREVEVERKARSSSSAGGGRFRRVK